jgi:hypothetical protein
MAVETIADPRRPGRKLRFRPWMIRWVMWESRGGSIHVATHAAVIGTGVVTRLACGGSGWGHPETSTWFYVRGHNPRVCRRCVAALAAAGESGRIG